MKSTTDKPSKNGLNKHDEKTQTSANEFNALNSYMWSAYASPFMPGLDLSFATDALLTMIKNWKQKITLNESI